MLVEDLMTTDIVTCEFDASLQRAVLQLVGENVGSVVVVRDGEPAGIVTETDSLVVAAAAEKPFTEIPVKEVIGRPVITTTREATIRKAVDLMKEHGIKKLLVVDGLDLEGILTVTDIAVNHSEVVKEARQLAEQQDLWERRNVDVDNF